MTIDPFTVPPNYFTKACLSFENGIALTRTNVGEGDWDLNAASWIPFKKDEFD